MLWLLWVVSWCRRRWLLCCDGDPPPAASRRWWTCYALKRVLLCVPPAMLFPPSMIFGAEELADRGWSLRALKTLWGFTPQQLKNFFEPEQIMDLCSVKELFEDGWRIHQLKGFKPVPDLVEVYGLSLVARAFSDEELEGILTPFQMERIATYRRISAGETRRRVLPVREQIIEAEQAAVIEMLEAQMTVAEMRQAGALAAQLRLCGFTDEQLLNGGYSPEEL